MIFITKQAVFNSAADICFDLFKIYNLYINIINIKYNQNITL